GDGPFDASSQDVATGSPGAEHPVPRIDVGDALLETLAFEGRAQLLHVNLGLAAHVDPAQERDVSHRSRSDRFGVAGRAVRLKLRGRGSRGRTGWRRRSRPAGP